jgi:antitoxin YefM
MNVVTDVEAQKNLKDIIRKVCADAEPTMILDTVSGEKVVMISLDHFSSYEETGHPLRSPANRENLEESHQQAQSGDETAYLLGSEKMKARLLEAKNRKEGIPFDEALEKLAI